jgi:hypothetical protein
MGGKALSIVRTQYQDFSFHSISGNAITTPVEFHSSVFSLDTFLPVQSAYADAMFLNYPFYTIRTLLSGRASLPVDVAEKS